MSRLALLQQQHGGRSAAPAVGPLVDPWQWWTAGQIASIVGAPVANVEAMFPAIARELDARGIWDQSTAAGVIATVGVEDAAFGPIDEAYWLSEAGRNAYYTSMYGPWTSAGQQLGNLTAQDAIDYHGRGPLQLTGRGNYQRVGDRLGVDLVGHPERANVPAVAAAIVADYWLSHDIDSLDDAGNWPAVRRAVNGGLNGYSDFLTIVNRLGGADFSDDRLARLQTIYSGPAA